MTILVTGGAGYIGSITTEILLERGHEVIVIDNLQDGYKEIVPTSAKFYEGSYGDKELLSGIFDSHHIDIVFHFAGCANIPLSIKDPGFIFRNNVVHGIVLLDTMLKYSLNRILVASSSAVYGNPIYSPIDENHPLNPVSVYGESKMMFDKIIYRYHQAYGIKSNIFRFFLVAGATKNSGEARRQENRLFPLAIDTLLGRRKIFYIHGDDYPTKDGTCIRDLVHVLDIVKAFLLAADNLEARPFEIYNLGSNKDHSVLDVISMLEKISGKKIPKEIKERRNGDTVDPIANYSKAKMELNWYPEFDLEEMGRSSLKWQKSEKYNQIKRKE